MKTITYRGVVYDLLAYGNGSRQGWVMGRLHNGTFTGYTDYWLPLQYVEL